MTIAVTRRETYAVIKQLLPYGLIAVGKVLSMARSDVRAEDVQDSCVVQQHKSHHSLLKIASEYSCYA